MIWYDMCISTVNYNGVGTCEDVDCVLCQWHLTMLYTARFSLLKQCKWGPFFWDILRHHWVIGGQLSGTACLFDLQGRNTRQSPSDTAEHPRRTDTSYRTSFHRQNNCNYLISKTLVHSNGVRGGNSLAILSDIVRQKVTQWRHLWDYFYVQNNFVDTLLYSSLTIFCLYTGGILFWVIIASEYIDEPLIQPKALVLCTVMDLTEVNDIPSWLYLSEEFKHVMADSMKILHVCTVHQWRLEHFIIQQMHKYIIRRYN